MTGSVVADSVSLDLAGPLDFQPNYEIVGSKTIITGATHIQDASLKEETAGSWIAVKDERLVFSSLQTLDLPESNASERLATLVITHVQPDKVRLSVEGIGATLEMEHTPPAGPPIVKKAPQVESTPAAVGPAVKTAPQMKPAPAAEGKAVEKEPLPDPVVVTASTDGLSKVPLSVEFGIGDSFTVDGVPVRQFHFGQPRGGVGSSRAFVSTVTEGKVKLGAVGNGQNANALEWNIEPGGMVRVKDLKADLVRVNITKKGVELLFSGTAKGLMVGSLTAPVDAWPTMLDYGYSVPELRVLGYLFGGLLTAGLGALISWKPS